ncbi:MAG: 16S rRNA (cytidine(1402)-2'-O)-methyltransferase [Ruminococcaceae bacterium]|nr:16S rRNA (cytidine(1402)-2'-O)-methyltransferase [Oscillospiraceae bacterium]
MSYIKKFDETSGLPEKNKIEGGTLYLVATPIGNLSDISPRACKVLSEVDFIAAEDTRNTGMLLSHLGIEKKHLISYFEHNKREKGMMIVEKLKSGQSAALVSDAGTPAISDPGEDLVALCAENGVRVTAVPGSAAVICALILSGLSTSRFAFEGFISGSKSERRERLTELSTEKRTLIVYEAPHKLVKTLDDLLEFLGNRKIALCRELTKLNEDVMRTTLEEASEYYKTNAPRGEYVLVIEGAKEKDIKKYWSDMTLPQHVEYLIETGMKKTDAIKAVAKERDLPKSEVYNAVLEASKSIQ